MFALLISPLNAPLHAALLSLDVSHNSLQSVPEELASMSLRRLTLGGNSALSLSHADVDSLLTRLPRLRELQLWSTATPNDVDKYAASKLARRAD